MSKKIFIFGTSGFSRELNDVASALGYEGIYIAENKEDLEFADASHEVITESDINRFENEAFAIGIGENTVRAKIAGRYKFRLKFPTLIHPDTSLGRGQKEVLNRTTGNIICAGVRVTNNVSFGNFCIVNLNSTIGHDVIIGDYVNIAPGANISGNVHLSRGVWVGTNAAVNQGTVGNLLTIGENTIVGSGSVVVKSCEPNAIYVGIPAKIK